MLILSSLLMALASSKAADAQTTTCDAELTLTALSNAISSATTFTNPEKDQQNLLAKVDAARIKLEQGKTADAIAKIEDIELAVNKLAAAGKLGQADANAIIGAADAAIACLDGTSTV